MSWRDPKGDRIPFITRESATEQIIKYRDAIVKGEADFHELARNFSDCSSAQAGGVLPPFSRGSMQPAFEAVAFTLSPGEVSVPVYTDSGVHIIERLES
jgi:NIMA-interacting peptidyl-prolyl cis-trans isomerase 1